MKLKTTDKEIIKRKKCESEGCNEKSEGIFKGKFLCEGHYEENNPSKSFTRKYGWGWLNDKKKD